MSVSTSVCYLNIYIIIIINGTCSTVDIPLNTVQVQVQRPTIPEVPVIADKAIVTSCGGQGREEEREDGDQEADRDQEAQEKAPIMTRGKR